MAPHIVLDAIRLDAEYYALAVTGNGLGGSSVARGRQVQFSDPVMASFAQALMQDEMEHVRFLRAALGAAPIPEPAINFRAGFGAVALAARLPRDFDPVRDELSFFARSPQAVLRILYATPNAGVRRGGFFPQGVNGAVATT